MAWQSGRRSFDEMDIQYARVVSHALTFSATDDAGNTTAQTQPVIITVDIAATRANSPDGGRRWHARVTGRHVRLRYR